MARRSVKSAIRVLEVLDCFAHQRTPLTQRAIMEKLQYPQSSTAALLRSLVDAGYVAYDRKSRRYFPTPAVMGLGSWLAASEYRWMFDVNPLGRMLHALRARTGETAALSMQSDIHVHWHRILRPRDQSECYVIEDRTYPLTSSSYGWALLSLHVNRDVEKLCRLINAQEPVAGRRIAIAEALRKAEEVRGNRYCIMTNTHVPGRTSIATPLTIQLAGRPVAVGVGGPEKRINERQGMLRTVLLKTVREFEAALREERIPPSPADLTNRDALIWADDAQLLTALPQ
jgi:DNA-binding IclR family transcriptional regulator